MDDWLRELMPLDSEMAAEALKRTLRNEPVNIEDYQGIVVNESFGDGDSGDLGRVDEELETDDVSF